MGTRASKPRAELEAQQLTFDDLKLSPSGLKTAFSCTLQPWLLPTVYHSPAEPVKYYSVEGDLAHMHAELELRKRCGLDPDKCAAEFEDNRPTYNGKPVESTEQMRQCALEWADLVMKCADTFDGIVYVEETLEMPFLTPITRGRADAIVYCPEYSFIEVFDFKYGTGVSVSAVDNWQGLAYIRAALLRFGTEQERMRSADVTIFQPRERTGNILSHAEYSIERLGEKFAEMDRYVDAICYTPIGNPTFDNCMFCPAKPVCKPHWLDLLKLDHTPGYGRLPDRSLLELLANRSLINRRFDQAADYVALWDSVPEGWVLNTAEPVIWDKKGFAETLKANGMDPYRPGSRAVDSFTELTNRYGHERIMDVAGRHIEKQVKPERGSQPQTAEQLFT